MRSLWAYTYLKHERTNYDQLCETVRGRMFAHFAYPIILHRVNKIILDAYPQCRNSVKGLRLSPNMSCGTCRKTQQGTYNGHYWNKPKDWVYRLSPNHRFINVYCSRTCSMPKSRKTIRARRTTQGRKTYP